MAWVGGVTRAPEWVGGALPSCIASNASTVALPSGNNTDEGDAGVEGGGGGGKARTHQCTWPNCGKSFSSRWGLDRHYRIHTGEKPWVCKVRASSSPPRRLQTARHCAVCHLQVEGCGKGFVDRALLARHERTHSKERPFLCPHPDCDKAFKVCIRNRPCNAVAVAGRSPAPPSAVAKRRLGGVRA